MSAIDLAIATSPTPTPRAVGSRRRGRAAAWILGAAAVGAWLVALPSLFTEQVDNRGLLFGASPAFVCSLLLVTTAFILAIRRGQRAAAAVSLLLSVLLTRLPTAVAVELPLYSWTYKHFGVIDYISTYGHLEHGVDIYHSWPGMFAMFAWVNQLTGTDSLHLALWFTPVFQVALTGAIYVLARGWRLSSSQALVAAFVAHTTNWVAQDYFSPQSIALLLSVGVLTLLTHAGSPSDGRGVGRPHKGAIWVALVLFIATVVTHQLTPYWLLVVIGSGCLLGMIRPRWVVVIFAAVAIAYMALNYDVVSSYGSLLSFNPMANAERNVQGSNPSYGQILTSWAGRITSVGLWAVTGAVLALRLRRRVQRRRNLGLAAVALGSFAVLLGQSYGGEAIFRVFLYSIPGCALVVAPAVERFILGRTRHPLLGLVAVVTSLLMVTGTAAQAFYGAWFANRVDADALSASVWIVENASPDTMVLALAPGAPGRVVARYTVLARVNRSFDGGVNAWDGWLGNSFDDPGRVNRLSQSLVNEGQPTFAVITRQMKVYNDYYGLFPPGAIDRFEQQLLANPHWRVRSETPTLTVLELDLES